jgi:hypothetical protein
MIRSTNRPRILGCVLATLAAGAAHAAPAPKRATKPAVKKAASSLVARAPAIDPGTAPLLVPKPPRPAQCGPDLATPESNAAFENSMRELMSAFINGVPFKQRFTVARDPNNTFGFGDAQNSLGFQELNLFASVQLKKPLKVSSSGNFGPPANPSEPHAELGAEGIVLNAHVELPKNAPDATRMQGTIYFSKGQDRRINTKAELAHAQGLEELEIASRTKDSRHAIFRIRSFNFDLDGSFFDKAAPNAKKKQSVITFRGTCNMTQESVKFPSDSHQKLQATTGWDPALCQIEISYDIVCGSFGYRVTVDSLDPKTSSSDDLPNRELAIGIEDASNSHQAPISQ